MFNDLTNFGLVRSTAQAIGFYIAYLCVAIVIAMTIGLTVAMLAPNPGDYNQSVAMGAITSAAICALLAFLTLKQKNRLGTFSSIVSIIVSTALALLGGGLLGLLVPAYLTTQEKHTA